VRAYFGHHKCGSTWVWEIVDAVCRELGLRHYLVLDELAPQARGPLTGRRPGVPRARETSFQRPALREHADAAAADFVSCIVADAEQLDALAPTRAFHVIRDPRDILVSAYFSHRNSHPTDGLPHLAEHRARLHEVSEHEGLLLEMDFSSALFRDLAAWDYDRPEILEVRLEDLATTPYIGFVQIFQHLGLLPDVEPTRGRELLKIWMGRTCNRLSSRKGLGSLRRPMPATGEIVLGTVYGRRFEAQTNGRRAGTEDTHSHYRKGQPGDWVNHFSPIHLEAFDERFGDLVTRLGYATADVMTGPVAVAAR
jgi:hypothetical protein